MSPARRGHCVSLLVALLILPQASTAFDTPLSETAVRDAYFLGIRSTTHLTAEFFEHAPRLIGVGCFCIGTNQVNLSAAEARGIPVFNAPFSNTRSVAELVLAEIVFLMRGLSLIHI